MYKNHVKFDDGYYLITQQVSNSQTIAVPKKVNHIVIIDVSDSMCYELPEIRKNLKNRISGLVKPDDTISIIWFSGKNEAGILKELVEVNSLKQLSDLNDAIDRFLKPICLTAFAKPLELAKEIIGRSKTNDPNSLFSLIFMSDGYNNDVAWDVVKKELVSISPELASSTIVEYGNYADSQKLTEMAKILGGEKINCRGFKEYDVIIKNKLESTVNGGKKIVVNVSNDYLYDFAFSMSDDGSVLIYNIENGKILVNENTNEVHYFSSNESGDNNQLRSQESVNTILYGAIYILSDQLKYDDCEKIFYALGDNFYYKELAFSYGKQKLNEFKSSIKECVTNISKRLPLGKEEIVKIDDNAYCLMNLINDLGNIDGCLFYPNHPDFEYHRIGTKRQVKGSDLSDDDKKRLSEAKNVDEANQILDELKFKNVDLKFIDSNPNKGYPLTDLVWNENRANLSIRVRFEGDVILPEGNKYGLDKIPSFIFRTYTIIKDGIINFDLLPLNYSIDLHKLVMDNKIDAIINDTTSKTISINLNNLPVINRSMVKSISANELAKQEWKLTKLKTDNKVYKYFRDQYFPKTSKTYVDTFGQECADWLKDIGITDYNGFAPKTIAGEINDFYMSVNLLTKIKGLSTIPAVKGVIDKIGANKPLKISEWIMSEAINNFLAQTKSEIYSTLSEEQRKTVLETYLYSKTTELNLRKRKAMQEIAQIKFSLILSKKWFKEFKSFDDNTLSLTLDNQVVNFTFDMVEKEVGI